MTGIDKDKLEHLPKSIRDSIANLEREHEAEQDRLRSLGKMMPDSDFKRVLQLVGDEFKNRGGAEEVSGELTTKPFNIDGIPCQMVVEVKLYPVSTTQISARQVGANG